MPTIRSTKGIGEVVVFHSDHEDSIRAVEEIGRTCQMMNVMILPPYYSGRVRPGLHGDGDPEDDPGAARR